MKINKAKETHRNDEDVDYWRSMVDVVIALLLVVLMVMSLLLLGLMDTPEGEGDITEVEPTPTLSPSPTPVVTATPTPTITPDNWHDGGGGGGDGDGSRYTPVPTPAPTFTPGPTAFISEYDKSAVRVIVQDEDSGLPIRLEGITFDLFSQDHTNLTLKVYYPQLKSYSLFETQPDGTFYLPEKLEPDTYILHIVSTPDMYDPPEDTAFELEKDHDWSMPYVVQISLSPHRGVIRLSVTDKSSKEPLGNLTFDVISKEQVITADGTIRYEAGEVVDTLITDKEGEAESIKLYIGEYELRLKSIPFGYAVQDEAVTASLKQGSAAEAKVSLSRTIMKITVRDGSTFSRLSGVSFLITGNNGSVEAVTDSDGLITLADLDKNTVYTYRQSNTYGDYTRDDTVYSFTVDEYGLIDGKAQGSATVNQHKIVCSFDVVGYISGSAGEGHRMTLLDASGATIREWYTESTAVTIQGISPGDYTLSVDGQENKKITVQFTSGEQVFSVKAIQVMDILIVGAAFLFGIGLIAGIILLVRRRSRKPD